MGPHRNATAGPSTTPDNQPRRLHLGRSCDRCRKRKVRCDEVNPCSNCHEARIPCTFDAPILKRGPRPKAPNTVEGRLKNLEKLIKSMSKESMEPDKDTTLLQEQLSGIRAAAQCFNSPDSGGHITPGSGDIASVSGTPLISIQRNDQAPSRQYGVVAEENLDGIYGGPSTAGISQANHHSHDDESYHSLGSQNKFTELGQELDMDQVARWFGYHGPLAEQTTKTRPTETIQSPPIGASTLPSLPPQEAGNGHLNGSSWETYSRSGAPDVIPATPSQSNNRLDMLYQDARGQTKWLGASSGLPLLDLLKDLNVTPESSSMGVSTAEDWITMSTASGLRGFPMTSDIGSIGSASRVSQHDIKTTRSTFEEDRSEDLWPRITDVVGQQLLDALVRAYFTTSHLLWPILHAPQFMRRYEDPQHRKDPSFAALVVSMACLSSRYIHDLQWGISQENIAPIISPLVELWKSILATEAADCENLAIVQTLFNLSVFMSGTTKQNAAVSYLNRAISTALQMGLHRRVDDWESFECVDIEVRKRTFWALYSLGVEMSSTLGLAPMLRCADCDVSEPSPVDDAYLDETRGILPQAMESASVMAGFVASVRLHVVLERAVTRINQVSREMPGPNQASFLDMAMAKSQTSEYLFDELQLANSFTSGLSGDWTFTPMTIASEDNVQFFRKTRAFALQHFIRLLIARHQLLTNLTGSSGKSPRNEELSTEINETLQEVTRAALGITGTYATILARGRLALFGSHAINQLTQSGSALIGVVLHLQGRTKPQEQHLARVAVQGLSSSIAVLRTLGLRRSAGTSSATVLAEFAKACGLPVVEAIPPTTSGPSENLVGQVPMLRALPRRSSMTARKRDEEARLMSISFDELIRSTLPDWQSVASASC